LFPKNAKLKSLAFFFEIFYLRWNGLEINSTPEVKNPFFINKIFVESIKVTSQYSSRWIKFFVALVLMNLFVVCIWFAYQQQQTNQNMQQKITELEKEIAANKNPEPEKIIEKTRQDLQLEQEHASVQYYRDSLASVAPIKTILSEAYIVEGKFPDNTDGLIPDLEVYRRGAIRLLSLDTNIPRIRVQLQTLTGNPTGYYYLDAKVDAESSMLVWSCKTFGDPLLQRALPECEFVSP
jgi:cell division protein FtsB